MIKGGGLKETTTCTAKQYLDVPEVDGVDLSLVKYEARNRLFGKPHIGRHL